MSNVFSVTPFILKCSPNLASPAFTLNPLSVLIKILVLIFAKILNGNRASADKINVPRFILMPLF